MTWTEQQETQLPVLVAAGLSAGQIAGELGVTRNAAIGKINREGLRLKASPANRDPNAPGRAERRRARRAERAKQEKQPVVAPKPKAPMGGLPLDPADAAAFDAAIPLEQRRQLVGLEPGMCKWPVNDPGTPEFFFCGGAAQEGFVYCTAHCRRAYRAGA